MFLLTALIGCSQASHTSDLVGEWVGVSNGSGSGLILDFGADDLLFGAIATDSITKFKYTYDKSTGALSIIFKGKEEKLGKIERIGTDRIILVTPGTTDTIRMEMIRIKDLRLTIGKTELLQRLKNSSWTTEEPRGSIRMDFLPTHRWENSIQPYEAMFHYWFSTPYKEKEVWNVGAYNGKLFMFFTFHQTDLNTRQVLEVDGNEILTTASLWEDSTQTQTVKWTKAKPQNIVSKLTQRVWRSVSVDTVFCKEWGYVSIRDQDVKELQLLRKMEFRFNADQSYSMMLGQTPWLQGVWQASSDGAYVILDDEKDKKNWIELRSEGENIILTKLQQIKDGDNEYKLYLLTKKKSKCQLVTGPRMD